eukprot:scaffold163896_cov21-Tisochrysis_lutea.AAC.4
MEQKPGARGRSESAMAQNLKACDLTERGSNTHARSKGSAHVSYLDTVYCPCKSGVIECKCVVRKPCSLCLRGLAFTQQAHTHIPIFVYVTPEGCQLLGLSS